MANTPTNQERSFTQVVGAAVSGPARVYSLHITSGSGAGSLSVYDHASSATGTALAVKVLSGETAEWSFEPHGIRFGTGVFVAATGTTPHIVVTYLAE